MSGSLFPVALKWSLITSFLEQRSVGLSESCSLVKEVPPIHLKAALK